MKKIYPLFLLAIFLISFGSTTITLKTELNDLYNLQDKIEFTLNINPQGEFNNLLTLILECPTGETEIYKEYLFTTENITKNIMVPLVKEFIGENKGLCQIKSKIENKSEALSKKFTISNKIETTINQTELLIPGETATIQGKALRENGKNVNGSIEAKIKINDDEEILIKEKIIDGKFIIHFDLPKNTKAGDKIMKFYAYEQNSKLQITNEGNSSSLVSIKQIPTNIEIQLEQNEIMPGENLKFKIILHDQTGEKINSLTYIAIKNQLGEILEQIKKPTEEIIEYPIKYDEAPNIWQISAYSEEIINSAQFKIKENEKIDIDMINDTLVVMNKGNVPYNETINIKLGGEIINLPIYLNVNQKEQYVLSAPKGEYNVEIGEFSKKVSLTGNAIDIKKLGDKRGLSSTIAWIILILILAFITYKIFKKTQKKNFFAKLIHKKNKKEKNIEINNTTGNTTGLINPKIKSDISLSISGSKQNACIGCVSIKNYEEIKTGTGNTRETMEEIIKIVEDKKGFMYQNKENLFFILAPTRTKTFQNEQEGVKIADKIKSIINEHNKKFKQKIEFGISLNYGTIVTKQENTGIKFMSMGTLLNTAKKLAKHAKEEIYIGEKVKERLGAQIKTEFKNLGTISVHILKEIPTKVSHSKFIDGFVARQKKEIAEREHKEKQQD